MNDRGRAGAGRVFQTQGIERNVGVQNRAQALFVEIGVVRARAAGGQGHDRDRHLMLQARLFDRLAGNDQVVRIVQGVEVANRRHAVFFEQLGVQFDQIGGHRIQPDDVDAARQRLQVRVGSRQFAEFVHHVKGVLVAVKESGLERRAAAGFEIADTRVARHFHSGEIVFGQNTHAESGLESVAERSAHKIDNFFSHVFFTLTVSRFSA